MNWFCCSEEHSRKIYPEYSYNWYIKSQPHNGPQSSSLSSSSSIKKQYPSINQRLIRCQSTKNPYQHENYARIKIKSKDIQQISSFLRNNRTNFIDDDFPHVYPNVSKDTNFNTDQIHWKRVNQVIPKAVYSLPKKQQYLSTFKSNNKALEICLTLISRTHPKKLQRIRNQKDNDEGVYEFKLFKDGIIHNVIIDDYVPCFKGFYVFTGPANEVQVYPMLLEKAIAKICGGYSQIPKSPLDIMEMIYCGAIRRQNLDDLRNLAQFRQLVAKTLSKQGLTILIAKKDKKIRQYGINDSQIYHIINQHQLSQAGSQNKQNKQQTLYQILSENRMSAWNGCFRITDPKWKQIDPKIRQNIMRSIQKNHSFIVSDKEIHRVFEALIVYQDTETMNKDWQENFSESGYPSFCRFQLKNKDTVFLRVTTKVKIRQSMILCKINGENSYQLVGGCFDDNIEFLQSHFELEPGNYLICVFQDWVLKKQGEYVIYLSSTCRTVLESDKTTVQNFLQFLFTEHSTRTNKNLSSIYYQALREIGFGYLRVFVKPPTQIKKIQVNLKKIKDEGWQILEPFNGMTQIVTTSNVLIILKMLDNKPKQLTNFPIQAFIVNG